MAVASYIYMAIFSNNDISIDYLDILLISAIVSLGC